MSNSDSDSESDNSSGSESSGSDQPAFRKKVVFKKTRPQQQQQQQQSMEDVAVSNINRNLKRLEQEQIYRNAQGNLVVDERILCVGVDDTDVPNDEAELQAWKRRELDRLHRDRNRRIAREEGAQ